MHYKIMLKNLDSRTENEHSNVITILRNYEIKKFSKEINFEFGLRFIIVTGKFNV
jgi:hypothetical protein